MKENIWYVLTHPLDALKAKEKQIMVSIEHEDPPAESNIEDFPNLPVNEAARLMGLGRRDGGVQLRDWPESAQKEMLEGKVIRPDGRHPEHRNI